MSPYWLATLPPILAVADSPKEWGVIGALFIISMALIKLVERFLPAKKGSYSDADRRRDDKLADVMGARNGSGMPRVWFPDEIVALLKEQVSSQRDGNQSIRDMARANMETNMMIRKISDRCVGCHGAGDSKSD